MLGGLSELNPLDIRDSESLLLKLFNEYGVGRERVAEMGAGIGRVSQQLFKKYFSQVHIFFSSLLRKFSNFLSESINYCRKKTKQRFCRSYSLNQT